MGGILNLEAAIASRFRIPAQCRRRLVAVRVLFHYFQSVGQEHGDNRSKKLSDLLKSIDRPVFVYFYAGRCPPCLSQESTVRELARAYRGLFETVRAEVGSKPGVAEAYGITVVPAGVLFLEGREILRLEGVMSYEKMKRQIDDALSEVKYHFRYIPASSVAKVPFQNLM